MTTGGSSGLLETGLALLAKTPELLGLLGAGRLSGQFWLYILMAHTEIPEKRVKYINNHLGITAVGLASYVPEFVLIYFVSNGFGYFEYESSLRLILTTIIASYAVKAIALTIIFMRRAQP